MAQYYATHLYCAECTNIARIVLSMRLKLPKLTDRLRNSVGSEFRTVVGPTTEKARRPKSPDSAVQSADAGWLIEDVGLGLVMLV